MFEQTGAFELTWVSEQTTDGSVWTNGSVWTDWSFWTNLRVLTTWEFQQTGAFEQVGVSEQKEVSEHNGVSKLQEKYFDILKILLPRHLIYNSSLRSVFYILPGTMMDFLLDTVRLPGVGCIILHSPSDGTSSSLAPRQWRPPETW